MNILELAILKKMVGGGGGSGTDNYNDLSNLPKINDTTLSGNKTAASLGLQNEINSDNKLSSDLVDDTGATNLFVTEEEKLEWSGKQDEITNANKLDADLVDDEESTNKFVTAQEKETWNAKQNEIDSSHKLSSDLVDDTNHTNKFVTSQEKETWNGKQNAIDSDHKLSSSLVSFTTAEAAALASGIDSSKVGQISTNQTNILYALNKVGTNYAYDYVHGMATPTTQSGVTFAWLDNGKLSIKSDGTNTSDVYYNLELDIGSKYVGKTMSFVGGVASKCAFYISRSSSAAAISTYGADVTIPSDAVNKLFISVAANAGALDIVVEPMIRDSNITSNTYSTPALPNYDLTRLEAEDRASLAEVVDSGAKNLVDLSSLAGYSDGSLTMTKASDGTITVTGTVTGSFVGVNICTITLTPGTYVLTGCPEGGGVNTWQLDINNGVYEDRGNGVVFTVTSTMSTVIRIRIATTSSSITKVFKPMICSKAAFDVSQKFVPYRPNWDLVGMLVPKTSYYTTNFSAANTWTYSNLSFTVPAGQIYILIASMSWNSGKPAGICISTSPTPTGLIDADIVAINETAANAITCMLQMPADVSVDKTFYCHVKNESASGSSPTRLTAIRIK